MKRKEPIEDLALPIIDLKQDPHDHPPSLLRHPFRCMAIGPSNSGKSLSIIGSLQKWYKQYFDKIYLVSPNAEISKTNPWSLLKLDEERIKTQPHELEKLIPQIEMEQQEKDNEPKVLLILDDMAGYLNQNRNSALSSFITYMRHKNCSLMLTTQKYRLIPPSVRSNSDHLLIWKITNDMERSTIFGENGDAPNILEIYKEAIKVDKDHPYPFLHINKKLNKFYKTFDTELIPDDGENNDNELYTSNDVEKPTRELGEEPQPTKLHQISKSKK